MKPLGHDRVIAVLRDPRHLATLDLREWDVLIRQGRSADLLARIAGLADEGGLLEHIPAAPRAHLESARILAMAQHAEVRREVAHVCRAVASLGVPVVLLKGAAYLLGGLPAALGRTFSDVDILVPRSRLGEVEAALMLGGWATTHHDPYDQRYYRQWMHELPPLQHIRRQTVLDVHHAILPDTARLKPDSQRLLDAAQPLPGASSGSLLRVLAPADMVLHSMTHLFHNEEMSRGLRDLSDLDRLLRHFDTLPGFWGQLVARSNELGLTRPLYYGLHQAHVILGTPVPAEALAAAGRAGPGPALSVWMNGIWSRALRSPHSSAGDRWVPATLFMLYVRAHWLRMPPGLLLRHLTIKAMRRRDAGAART